MWASFSSPFTLLATEATTEQKEILKELGAPSLPPALRGNNAVYKTDG